MATQSGIFKITGTLGDVTFRKTKKGYRASIKSSLNKEKIATDPRFARTRENGREFGRAGKAGKVLRNAFALAIGKGSGTATTRMMKVMLMCLKSDAINPRGQRDVVTGDLTLVQGYSFNESTDISSALRAPYYTSVNRPTGLVSISIPAFVPAISLTCPNGATHFRFITAASSVDFAAEDHTTVVANSAYLPIDSNATSAITLTISLAANTTLPIFVALGIRFYQEVNGTQYVLNGQASDAITIVKVDV